MTRLERVTHICLIGVSLLSAGLLIERRLSRGYGAGLRVDVTQTLRDRPLDLIGPNWGAAELNVVLYLATRCRYCTASMPLYRQLAITRDVFRSKIALYAASSEHPDTMRAVLEKENVRVDGVYQIGKVNGLDGTPILMLLDAKGIVRRVFRGELAKTDEEVIISLMTQVGSRRSN